MIPARMANRLKALVLILLAIFFAQRLVSGQLYYYIAPRFAWLAVVAVVLLIILASAYNLTGDEEHDHDHDHDHGHHHDHDHPHGSISTFTMLMIAMPLILGVLVPASPLDANAIENRGISTSLTGAAEDAGSVLSIVPSERNVLDWVRAMGTNPDPNSLTGEDADLIGFIYRDPRFGEDQFMVARFTLSCCVADATAIGVVVSAPDAAEFETDTWVRVTGTFAPGELDGGGLPVIIADEITPVEAPEQPYLFQ